MERSMVEQAKLGDREAFTRLAFELSDHLFAVAHRILRDFDAAGDALQVTLLRIWRDLPSLRDPDRFEAWAYRVLLRACQDQLRRQNRQPRTLHLLAADAIAADPALAIVNREQLDRAFRTLTTEQRAAIVLQYYRDMSLPQIAEVLQVPIGTVRSRLHYAKRALRSAIDADSRPTTREGRTA
ncbi:MAG: sigma-70 family RNA polymerase sigma factor [Chloroflexi bacterium]|nr:MAG: sigma-70 family RNA polymerase sigma factor [Chloroflexota bacterium]